MIALPKTGRLSMTTKPCNSLTEQQRVMALFKQGRSKSEIGREIGKTKEQVGRLLAVAIKETSDGRRAA